MFGNLRVKFCGLEPQERELYNSAFCTVCHDLRANSGLLSTLLTNYDSTFWLVLAQGILGEEKPAIAKRPCNGFPLNKVKTLVLPQNITRSNTALLWLLAEAKARDDVQDEGSRKASVFLRLGKQNIARFTELLQSEGFPVASVRQIPEKQRLAEVQALPQVQAVAEPTTTALGEIFSHMAKVCEREDLLEDLRRFGQLLGLAIFLTDALEDRKEDERRGSFNASLHCADFQDADFEYSMNELRRLLTKFSLNAETERVLRRALSRLQSKHRSLRCGQFQKPRFRPLARLKRAGFALSPFGDKEDNNCCNTCCSNCNPCEGCCEGVQCCGDCGGCEGCGDCGGCDGCCDCGGCDCGCAC